MHLLCSVLSKFIMFNLYVSLCLQILCEFNYLIEWKGNDKLNGKIIICNGRSVEIIYSQNTCPSKETHYTTSHGKFCYLHRDIIF